jgi:hypothetical protein
MLSAAVIREVIRLLDEEELSQRAIALRLDVSRGTVWAVAQGRRGLDFGDQRPRAAKRNASRHLPARCPGCGGFVFLPCRLCTTRAFARRRVLLTTLDGTPAGSASPRRAA